MTPTSAETTLAYPIARKADQTDDYFGTKVSDPYRWMEDVDSPELKTWIDAENELTQNYLAQIPLRETMQRRLTELLNFERYTAPSRRGTRYFYSHNSGLQNQNVLFWQEGLDRRAARPPRPQHLLRRRNCSHQRHQHHRRRRPRRILHRRRRQRLGQMARPQRHHRRRPPRPHRVV